MKTILFTVFSMFAFAQASSIQTFKCEDVYDRAAGEMILTTNSWNGRDFFEARLEFASGDSMTLTTRNSSFSEEEEGEYSLRIHSKDFEDSAIYCEKLDFEE